MTYTQPRFVASSFAVITLLSAFLTVSYFANDVPLRLSEKACRLSFEETTTKALLAVENTSGRPLAANFKIELLDPQNHVRYRVERDESIKVGASTLHFDLTQIGDKYPFSHQDKLWFRLHYVITPHSEANAATSVLEGTISASEITPDIFDLQVFASQNAYAGMRYQARVRTAHPLTGNPVSGVNISALAKYELNEKERELKATATTNQDGYAVITMELPKDFSDDDDYDVNIEFIARKGSLEREEEIELSLLQTDTYIVTTDKTLYQPGQTIHARALIFDPQKRARADYELDAIVEDAEEQKVFRTKLKTSKFGVAYFDWQIPESARLGGYKITIGNPSPVRAWGEAHVKVSRYDLPTFAVKVKLDKEYYLPNENAEVEIKADYLFGQPVTKGTVKVVREAERQWNNKTYKYDIEAGETYRGETDASGKFIAKINLKEQHEEFTESDYRKFEDIHFAAYFTDVTIGRTEQRKFDLRLTKEPIHVYLIKEYDYAPNELIDCYVNASYADGSPAQCEVAIYQKVDSDDADKKYEQKLLTKVSTNKYGLAKITGLQRIKEFDTDNYDIDLIVQAHDAQGKTGKLETEINIDEEPMIRVATDKTLYRAGEAINATIKTSVPKAQVVLEVLQNNRVVSSQLLEAKDGSAGVVIPYKPELKDDVTLVAYANIYDEDDEEAKFVYSSRAVLFPRDRELKVEVKLPRTDFQPGEEVRADLLVKTADGKPVNSALGAVIVDTAVGERERTDNEFRGHHGYFGYYYGDANLAGITRRDLDKLDLKQSIPEGLDLVAEILLKNRYDDRIENHHDSEYKKDQRQVFSTYFDDQFRAIKSYLESEYNTKAVYPKTIASLKTLLHRINLDPEELRDPWGTPYRIGFSTNRALDEMVIECAGADKTFDSKDDFTVLDFSRLYFRFTGEAINRAIASYQARTGDYVRDAATLKSELKREGIDFDALRDPWGGAYHVHLQKGHDGFYLVVRAAGPDQKLETEMPGSADDVEVWRAKLDYFSEIRYRIEKALNDYERATKTYPGDEAKFREAMQRGNVQFDGLRDPLGHRLYAMISKQSYYSDRAESITYSKFGEKAVEKTELIPITQTRISINIRGAGNDDEEGTKDDFEVTSFSRVIAEQSARDRTPVKKVEVATEGKSDDKKENKKVSSSAAPPGLAGTITGKVTDPSNAVVPNTVVTATSQTTAAKYSTRTNDEGIYFLRGLPPDVYDVTFEAAGFKKHVVGSVRIVPSKAVAVDAVISVGTVSETVTVTGSGPAPLQTESTSAVVVVKQVQNLPLNGRNLVQLAKLAPGVAKQGDISTPRLREYFPETLLWQPNIETDKQGRAQLKFKLADNITTWKLSLLGSTVDGQIGAVEQDIRAFQPFFAELDPPKVLTEGDEISLPVVLRNYLDKAQAVDLQFKPESWFTLLSPARKRSEVRPNDSAKEIFAFRAIASIKDGKQRVTAIGSTASDAIEKAVSVHPDGEELANTVANVFGETGTLEINVPADAIKGSVRAELKVYPNLIAHVTEGIEGILKRPYGCGEQTISSTYPNVMALRLLKSTGQGEAPHAAAIAAKARKFAQAGYERLLGYRDASGGFAYWSKGGPDLALTAYALRFLNDTSDVIEVDDDIIDEARAWLLKQQYADGKWVVNDYYNKEDLRRSVMYTALIARALTSGGELSKEEKKAVDKAFDYLASKLAEMNEPYSIALYALAAQQSEEKARAKWAVEQLRKMTKEEAGGIYWALETNTPFYGWGAAGRIETTALAVKALQHDVAARRDNDTVISKGVYWLLCNKDRYGVWLSTQATINVLDAFVALSAGDKTSGEIRAEVLVNGQRASTITLPPSHQLSNPIVVDLTSQLTTGNNRVEIKRPSNAALATAQLVETHYLPWAKSLATVQENFKPGQSRALRLAVNFDKTEAKIGDDIICKVEAERVGQHGYGMMLAEIGLPPGADVDRASLELAVKNAGYAINHYDVLPDRVIFYLWPSAGGCKFSFQFRSRFGTKAQSAASILYDYYNPEARAVVAPMRFVVK